MLGCLTAHYPLDQFAPAPQDPSSNLNASSASDSASRGVHVEPWFGSKAGQNSNQGPKWHVPNPAERQFAEELVQAFLVEPSAKLLEISQEQNGKYPKETLQALLLQIEGTHHGLRAALPDFASGADATSPAGSKLALVGCAAPTLGSSETRDSVARSLLAAAGYVGANDYETLGILLRCLPLFLCCLPSYTSWTTFILCQDCCCSHKSACTYCHYSKALQHLMTNWCGDRVMSAILCWGSHEFQEAIDSFSSWKSDQDVAFDPPLAALLFDQVHIMPKAVLS